MTGSQSTETSSLQFIKWNDLYKTEKPYQIFIDLPPDTPRTNVQFEDKDIVFKDVRGDEDVFALDTHGFMMRHTNEIEGLDDDSTTEFMEKVYLPSVVELIKKEVQGADRVKIFDWRLRSARSRIDGETINLKNLSDRLAPANNAHLDQEPSTAVALVRRVIPDEADELLKGRFRIINVWRPLHHAVEDWPLTLCDGTTITYDDLLSTDVVREDFEEHVGSNMFVMHSETSRWYYISKQKPNEAWIFKQFDTNEEVMARFCAHASFKHQIQPDGILPRESVEVRALVFTDA